MPAWGYLPQQSFLKDSFMKLVGHPHPYGRVRAYNVLPLINPNLKTLDVGCGEGVFTRELTMRGLQMTGMDLDHDAVQALEKNKDVLKLQFKVTQGDAEKIPFSDGTFEQVISTDVIEHVPTPQKALNEISRVLKKDGTFVLTVPTPHYLAKPIIKKDFSGHIKAIGHLHHGWYIEELRPMLEQAGFKIEKYRYFGHWPMRFAMEFIFSIIPSSKISDERKGMYNLKWAKLLMFALFFPLIWVDALFPSELKAACVAVKAKKI